MVSGSVRARFGQYEKLIRTEPVRARREIAKHLDGNPVITPLKGGEGVKRAVISGRMKPNSLLAAQEQIARPERNSSSAASRRSFERLN